jgi:hypothetical protein
VVKPDRLSTSTGDHGEDSFSAYPARHTHYCFPRSDPSGAWYAAGSTGTAGFRVRVGETVLVPKGAPVNAALTFADPGHGSAPGDLVFEIHSIEIAGKHVPLFGGETLEGLKGGKNAKIKPGMTAMAFVAADTLVK